MAWSDNLLDASFRGVTFDCLRTQDSAQRDTASHEYPYLDGADVEDLGRKARRITLSAIFFGKDYESRLQAFLTVLGQAGQGELIHPVFGSIKQAQLTDYQLGHDADNPDACTVELIFTEATPGNPFFVQQLPVQKAEAVKQLSSTSQAKGIEAFAKALDGLKGIKGGLARLNALRDTITGTLGAIRSQVQGIISTTLDVIDYPRAFAADVMAMVSGIADLRGFDIGVMVADWNSVLSQFDNIVKLPGNTGSSSAGQMPTAKTEDIALVTALLQLAVATVLADTASQLLALESEQPSLSPPEIEQIAADVRTQLQAVMTAHRDLYGIEDARPVTESLKDTALALQDMAAVVINAKPPMVTRTVEADGNLHLTAFRWYGDYTRAAELARLNPQVNNPNTIHAGDILNAYAR